MSIYNEKFKYYILGHIQVNEIATESVNDVTTTSPNERTAQYFATNEKQDISTNELPELSADIKTEVMFAADDDKVELDEEEIDLTTDIDIINDIADSLAETNVNIVEEAEIHNDEIDR